ncbi:metal-dependent hydrolase, beta-lactamase superfamily III [Desulfitobacterium dehalogenans ATCC 51507]|uniref:Metal-dependent hydrolase, beta-lactamase superfamily III n=1 Tax=Desulfitobacterium dehalogenans (strain ATCC 51507 / DSM 9161 / JW/IU-DC1) TaxID=756499 RepID=I4A432_DESDJ|nr:MBL fold metallo-hydrolase [Desulfitobacterium dehalogenans]AFL98716.1 metal-dependent hydrolase, beta-lactamase superfamily III [Desulfitobacterium dehalogenans ATCC 51507]
MKNLIVLGTGHAVVTQCYNTCFVLVDKDNYVLVDGGGGNGILSQLQKANIPYDKIHHAFISHCHTDHLLGMVWVIRMIGSTMVAGKYEGDFNLYCHDELASGLHSLVEITMDKKIADLIGRRIHIISVADGQQADLLGHTFTFFDLHSTKAKQFGFTLHLDGNKKLTFMGDEPYNSLCEKYAENSDWLLCEAFCLYEERELFKPYEKHHSTVKDACELATLLNVKNLILWHTEDKNIEKRKILYTIEGKQYFKGNLLVPDDLDVIEL